MKYFSKRPLAQEDSEILKQKMAAMYAENFIPISFIILSPHIHNITTHHNITVNIPYLPKFMLSDYRKQAICSFEGIFNAIS